MILNKNTIIWSKGFINNNYSIKNTEFNSSENDIIDLIENSNNIIFIRNGSFQKTKDLYYFSNNLHKLKNPITLITTDGDRPVPSSYDKNIVYKILNSENIINWYTQNYDLSIIHNKLHHYPIGFDLHTQLYLINNNIDDKINFMIKCRQTSPTNKRIKNRIFTDSHNSISHIDRIHLLKKIKNNNYIDFSSNRKSFKEIIEYYSKYNFVLSPRGNGLDCHRTWELLLLGVIVITKTSSLDNMFIKNNLPVVILNDWNELNENIEQKLTNWYLDNIYKTYIENIFPKLHYQYWLNN